jgi:hypothetical protein
VWHSQDPSRATTAAEFNYYSNFRPPSKIENKNQKKRRKKYFGGGEEFV